MGHYDEYYCTPEISESNRIIVEAETKQKLNNVYSKLHNETDIAVDDIKKLHLLIQTLKNYNTVE